MEEKRIQIGTIENYYGQLEVKTEGEKYYWAIEDHDGYEWEEIPQSLYNELVQFNKKQGCENRNRNRIWEDGEGMSWSTITELLGEDNETATRLKDLVLDHTDELLECRKYIEELQRKKEAANNKVKFINGNLSQCILFGERRLSYDKTQKYVHDKRPVTVTIKIANDHLWVNEEKLTIVSLPNPKQ